VTVQAAPGAAGEISGPATVTQGDSDVPYSIAAIPDATGYSWTLPAGASITTGANTNSITVTFSESATSGMITVYATNDCGNGASSPDFEVTVEPLVPVNLSLNNITVNDTRCYNATKTITVAGSESYFVVESTGNVTLIAGEKILILAGTAVLPGGYLHGYISTVYCGTREPAMVGSPMDIPDIRATASGFIRLYPNPTSDKFTLETHSAGMTSPQTVSIYTMLGDIILQENFSGNISKEFSLEGKPAGIYIIRVSGGENTRVIKVLKN
jgi:hypothetical protein